MIFPAACANTMSQHMTLPLRQLVVVVESTAALGYQWSHLLSEYAEKIVRAFYGQDVNGTKLSVTSGETGLVLFNSHRACHGALVQLVGWTSSMDIFLRWLHNIQFSGGGFGEVAMAEGLAEALLMCIPGEEGVANVPGSQRQKHVLLIATSAPCSIPKPVVTPPIRFNSDSGASESETRQWRLADSEEVAKWFPQCYVSLSVISPRRLPQLRSVYNLAKRNTRSADPEVVIPRQYSNDTVLLSDGFWEARAVLGINGNNSSVPPGLEAGLHDIPIASGQATSVIDGPSVGDPTGKPRTGISSLLPPVRVVNTKATTGTGVTEINAGSASSTDPVLHALNSVSHNVIHQASNNDALQAGDGSFEGVAHTHPPQGTGTNSFPEVTIRQECMGIGPNARGDQGVVSPQAEIAGAVANGMRPTAPPNLIMRRGGVSAVGIPNSQLAGGFGQETGISTAPFGQLNSPRAGVLTSGSKLPDRVATHVGRVAVNRIPGVTGTPSNIAQPTQGLPSFSVTPTSQQTLQQQTFQPEHTLGQPPAKRQHQVLQSSQAVGGTYAKLWDGVLAPNHQGQRVSSLAGITKGQASMGTGINASGGQVGVSSRQVDMARQGNVANGLHPNGMQPANLIITREELPAVSVPDSRLPGGLSQARGLGTPPIGQHNSRSAGGLRSGSHLPNREATQIGGVRANRIPGVTGTLSNIEQPTQGLQPSSVTQTSQQSLPGGTGTLSKVAQPTQVLQQSSVTQTSHQTLQQQTLHQPQHTIGQPPVNPQQQVPQSSQAAGGRYAKLWDGVLAANRQGQTVAICKLECYRLRSSPETLAADWPSTIRIMRLIDQDLMSSVKVEGKPEVLTFRALNQHPFLLQLAENKLRAVIELPSQTILLASTPKEGRMVGVLFPSHVVIFKPTNANPQQRPQEHTAHQV